MHVAAKIKISVTPGQEDVLRQLSEKCRLVYNFALAERNRNDLENKDRSEKRYSGYVQQATAPPELKKKYPEIPGHSQEAPCGSGVVVHPAAPTIELSGKMPHRGGDRVFPGSARAQRRLLLWIHAHSP